MISPSRALNHLERLKSSYDSGVAPAKLELLELLDRRRLTSAREVLRLHEVLCFWRAYPDNKQVLEAVEAILSGFDRRADLKRFCADLTDSGVAGCDIYYRFFWPTARWLAERWPGRLHLDWEEFEHRGDLAALLPLLLPYGATPALDVLDLTAREWVDELRANDETDAVFVIQRFAALSADSFARESMYESLDVPIRLAPGSDTPARGRARFPGGRTSYQRGPLSRTRPTLRSVVSEPPLSVTAVSKRRGQALIDLARESMVSRSRDLDAFAYGDPQDVRLVDVGEGLEFACIGQVPERRLMFESVYGYLTLKNRVPIGYVLSSALFGSAEVAYNIFDTYRGAEAAKVFGKVLQTVRHLYEATSFAIDPYQLGYGNAEGLESGAWWFYYKLGFRPVDPDIKRLATREVSRVSRNRRYRSSIATLERLAADYMYLHLGRKRRDVMGLLDLGPVGLRIASYVAQRFGGDRKSAADTCSREAAKLLGTRLPGPSSGERLAWQRWSPLVLILPGVVRWSRPEKKALAQLISAKGGRRESDFVRLLDGHARLRRALVRMARG